MEEILRQIYASLLDTFVSCHSTKMMKFHPPPQKKVLLNTFISCHIPGELGSVTDIVTFCHAKVCSDRKRLAPQDYTHSQCKEAIRHNVTSGATNLAIRTMRTTRCGIHRLITRVNFSSDIAWHCAMTVNHCWNLPDIESDIVTKTNIAVCEHHAAPAARHGVVKFSSVSGTSTTETVQKGWLNRPWLKTESNQSPLLGTS